MTTNQFHTMTKKALVSIAASYGCKSLISVETDAKTVKGSKLGYRTAIVYMQPDMVLCPMSKAAGCYEPCLNTAGLASVYSTIANARKARTAFFHDNKPAFMALLKKELDAFIKKAEKDNFIPVIRLNGTSDIDYSAINFYGGLNIFNHYSAIQFYDYSKKPSHARKAQSYDNYHITLSYSAASKKYAEATIAAAKKYHCNIAVVFDGKDYPAIWHGMPVVNGDESDLRFKDGTGKVVALYAKGKAKKDDSGFVQSTKIIAKG
jgi:hypothetical protein